MRCICSNGFSKNSNLQNHKLEYILVINLINVIYVVKCLVRIITERHIRTHIGDKPYKCDIGGKVFSQNHHLETH
jgi:uncharacterized Zn-finger protein